MGTTTEDYSLDFVNYLNIGLMIISCALAFYMPFEILLVSYAFLGPLHYLTEISWLHDKNYYVKGKYDPYMLILPAIPLTLAVFSHALSEHYIPTENWVGVVVGVSFGFSAGITFCETWRNKILVTLASLVITVLLIQHWALSIIIALLLPSLIHVYGFTGLFIWYGSLKSKSLSGHLSFVFYLICPFIFYAFQPTYGEAELSNYVTANIPPFMQLRDGLLDLVGTEANWDITVAIMRFLAFAYTYHYLNWFSKTKVIRWHDCSRQRTAMLTLVYVASVALYVFDYALGFVAAYFLGLLHVFLEFPLNHRSFVGIAEELKARVARS
jgi:hypothetical protein